jgi:hypothetical protein
MVRGRAREKIRKYALITVITFDEVEKYKKYFLQPVVIH